MTKVLTVVGGLLSVALLMLIVWRVSTGATGKREREEELRATAMKMVDALTPACEDPSTKRERLPSSRPRTVFGDFE